MAFEDDDPRSPRSRRHLGESSEELIGHDRRRIASEGLLSTALTARVAQGSTRELRPDHRLEVVDCSGLDQLHDVARDPLGCAHG